MKTTATRATTVVKELSHLIMANLRECALESRQPSYGADESDARIKETSDRAKELRALRERFEDLMTGALL